MIGRCEVAKVVQERVGRERSIGWFLAGAGILTLALLGYAARQGDVSLASFLVTKTVPLVGASFVVPPVPVG